MKLIAQGLRWPSNGWTIGIMSHRTVRHETRGYSFDYSAYGIALLWYRPKRRLSVSFWGPRVPARNVRLWGPRKLTFEK